jgi:hypothetical protein
MVVSISFFDQWFLITASYLEASNWMSGQCFLSPIYNEVIVSSLVYKPGFTPSSTSLHMLLLSALPKSSRLCRMSERC